MFNIRECIVELNLCETLSFSLSNPMPSLMSLSRCHKLVMFNKGSVSIFPAQKNHLRLIIQ